MKGKKKEILDLTALLRLEEKDEAEYRDYCQKFYSHYQPKGEQELQLVASIADVHWSLSRVPWAESVCYAYGRERYAHLFPDSTPEMRAALIEAHTYVTHTRDFNKLHQLEYRLAREADKLEAQLKQVQRMRLGAYPVLPHWSPVLESRGLQLPPASPPQPEPPPPPPAAPTGETKVLAVYLPNDFAYSDLN
jgi:hypothetical protein